MKNPLSCSCTRTVMLVATFALVTSGCSVNPATGRRQLSLVGEASEIALGRDNDKSVRAQMGLYNDEELQVWIQQIGKSVASRSERPDLPWTFRVVDDPAINAFALPGGYIYVTRGILAHFGSEAELVSVLGHEIGHVTGRHAVARMSKAQLTGVLMTAAMIASPELRGLGNAAQQGLGLMFLKFSRDDEREADDLGLRYMLRTGHRADEMPKVFDTLARASAGSESQRLPDWLSTHPAPPERATRMRDAIAALPENLRGGIIGRDSYLKRIDGLVYGSDPREGFFRENVFYQPQMRFTLTFPRDWRYANTKAAVMAQSPGGDAALQLKLARGTSPSEAAREFFRKNKLEQDRSPKNGVYTFRAPASAKGGQPVIGMTRFVLHGDTMLQLIGFTPENRWSSYRNSISRTIDSFARLKNKRLLGVKPARLDIVRIPRRTTLKAFHAANPSSIELPELARINGVSTDSTLERGAMIKRVVGGVMP
ncbi:MAG: putative Zn-dependent protease [Hyphomicrobiaceae bacterium]|jgi:predicted Zn-dependent protease